jgi:iron(III) transport system substrate-binding protein
MRGVFLSFALAVMGFAAEAATVDSIANYTGADRQAMLEKGAKAEGEVLLYATGTQIDPLIARFMEKYPYIRAKLFRGGTPEITKKALEEYKAGMYTVDGYELAGGGLIPLRDAGYLAAFTSPETAAYPADAIEQGRHWIAVRESYNGLAYNTKAIGPDIAPKTWQDLLNPALKGKISMTKSASLATEWTGNLLLAYGEDYLRKLAEQKLVLYSLDGRAIVNLMVTGEVMVSASTANSHVAAIRDKKPPIAWVSPGPVPVTDTVTAIAAKAPHPNAMMLLLDFLISDEGQKMYKDIGYSSARKGLEDTDAPKEKVYMSRRPTIFEDFEKWNDLFNKLFVQRS